MIHMWQHLLVLPSPSLPMINEKPTKLTHSLAGHIHSHGFVYCLHMDNFHVYNARPNISTELQSPHNHILLSVSTHTMRHLQFDVPKAKLLILSRAYHPHPCSLPQPRKQQLYSPSWSAPKPGAMPDQSCLLYLQSIAWIWLLLISSTATTPRPSHHQLLPG